MAFIQYRCSHLALGRTWHSFALAFIHLALDATWLSGAWQMFVLDLGHLDLILLGPPALGPDSQHHAMDIDMSNIKGLNSPNNYNLKQVFGM